MQSQKITDFQKLRNWQKHHGGELFETLASLEWFIRKHRSRLISSGEFIPQRGAKGSLIGRGFEGVVVQIIRSQHGYDHE